MGRRVQEEGARERRAVMARIGVELAATGDITPPRKRADFPLVSRHERAGLIDTGGKQMTTTEAGFTDTGPDVGAPSHVEADWHQIDWYKAHRIVRRLQARIVQATQAGRWGKVTALQRLLTHSHSAKVLAVRRVTENHGKKTPGVDRDLGNTPAKKMAAVHALRQRGYHPRPLRRVYIPKSAGKMRPLSIAAHPLPHPLSAIPHDRDPSLPFLTAARPALCVPDDADHTPHRTARGAEKSHSD